MQIAFYHGKDNTRTLKVYSNGKYHSKIKSNGKTTQYQTFDLDTNETSELKLYLNDYKSNSDVWLSITEVGGYKRCLVSPCMSFCMYERIRSTILGPGCKSVDASFEFTGATTRIKNYV